MSTVRIRHHLPADSRQEYEIVVDKAVKYANVYADLYCSNYRFNDTSTLFQEFCEIYKKEYQSKVPSNKRIMGMPINAKTIISLDCRVCDIDKLVYLLNSYIRKTDFTRKDESLNYLDKYLTKT